MSVETFRHQCEVRWCITKGFAWFEQYVKDVKKFRGIGAAKALWDDVKAQASKGNTGIKGEWK